MKMKILAILVVQAKRGTWKIFRNKLKIYLLPYVTRMFFDHESTSYMHGCTLNVFIHGVESNNRDNAHVICFVIV